jgi:Lrp/AsnC family leucine-responsive transcriptional regulator
MNKTPSLDKIDLKILETLQQNSRISNLELANAVGLSPTPCARRVKRLEDEQVILSHKTVLNESLLGLKLSALISISMDRHTPERFEKFEKEISLFPEIVECNIVTGQSADYLLKAILPDMAHYEAFLLGKLTKIDGVSGVHTSFILRKVIDQKNLPLSHISNNSINF